MDTIINQIITNFDFAFMFTINVLTYCIIKTIDYFNGDKQVSNVVKKLILILSIIIVTIAYIVIDYNNNKVLLNSAIAAPVFWSWIMKPICIKLNIDYKHIDSNNKK